MPMDGTTEKSANIWALNGIAHIMGRIAIVDSAEICTLNDPTSFLKTLTVFGGFMMMNLKAVARKMPDVL